MKELSWTERKRIVSGLSKYTCAGLEWGGLAHTVNFCAGVQDALSMMREARKMHSILLTLQLLCMLSLLAIVDLKRVIVARDYSELARVVEVEGRYRCLVIARSESLGVCQFSHGYNRVNKKVPSQVGKWI